ncbi:MAG: D-alanyl-D-alanine carboxypeptidase family protein [bacterium]|nr:D-alanyl-D-alanine carboxypeptidase family protein [bacterium]
MIPFFYVAVILLIAVNLLFGFSKTLNLAQTKIFKEKEAVVQKIDIPKVTPLPRNLGLAPPQVSAVAVFVEDLNTNTTLFTKDAQKRVPIASTTKIMTALVAVNSFPEDAVLTVPAVSLVEGSNMGLKLGEKLSLRSLLYGMLLNSGNDAAYTIAANYPGGVGAFVREMNRRVSELGLSNTHFDNPAGFDSPNHYSSASDLARIASLVSQNHQLSWVVGTKEATVASADKSISHPLKNLNKLLDIPGVLGMKTGTTPLAKENLVGLAERGDHKILTVVLGSEDRFRETEKLLDWTDSNFRWPE